MEKKINILCIFAILLISVFIIFVSFKRVKVINPFDVYRIYLNDEKIGLIANKEELLKLIDEKQNSIKEEFKVDKVYPPDSLEIVEYKTYRNNIKTAQEIYNTIEKKSTFTIKGYVVTIKKEEADPIYINVLNKEDIEPAFIDAVSVFLPEDNLNAYINDTQVKISDTGKTVESVYFEEKITVKESYINVDEPIITNQNDLAQYLIYGTLEKQTEYTVKAGDTIEIVAEKNKLSPEEILVSNNNLTSINSLLSPGQKLNIGYVNPLFTFVEESEIIEDIETAYNTIYEEDSSIYASKSYVKQEGKKGVSRVTEKVLYKNGEIMTLVVSEKNEISAPINKVVVKGTKVSQDYNVNYYPPAASATDWGWPTTTPYVITSYYGYRKLGGGKFHAGIDISGSGFGSPIYSATEGTVKYVYNSCANNGYYGSPCGDGYGNAVKILTPTGLTIYYAHIKNNITVKVGDYVSKGQHIGYMGNSGSSTGTHLHFEINDANGNKLNPCKVAFSC